MGNGHEHDGWRCVILLDPIPMKLKEKYLHPFCKTQKSSSNRSGGDGRHKLNAKQKALLPPQPKMVMHVVGGKARMVRMSDG